MKAVPAILLAPLIPAALLLPGISRAADFAAPVAVTDGSGNDQLARNPGHCAAFDSLGRLHLVYWQGGVRTSETTPSFVYHTRWDPVDGWSAPVILDNSESGGAHIGGRHPSLAIQPGDTVFVTWHDHRHSTASPGAWIDNVEIYADKMPLGGTFSSSDIRLSETSAPHLGDSGYVPIPAALDDGSLAVTWYDFNADNQVSDLYIKYSGTNGDFSTEPLSSLRLTDLDDRGGSPSYTLADLAVDSNDDRFAIWIEGTGGASPIHFASVPKPPSILAESTIASDCAGYFDPPKIVAAPNDDLWVVYTDVSGSDGDVLLLRRPAGGGAFDAPVNLASQAGIEESAGDLAVDDSGDVHAAWIDERNGRHVFYSRLAAPGYTAAEEIQVTETAGPWERPAIVLNGGGEPWILFEENSSGSEGTIWAASPPPTNTTDSWSIYR